MRKDLGKQPAVFPMPVLMVAAYDEKGTVQVMNAAWIILISIYYIPQPTAAIKPKSKKAKRIILFVDARAIMHIYGILYQIHRELNSPASIHTKG